VLDLVRDLADEHGVTVGVVLHDLNQAAALAAHRGLLDGGRVVAAGPPERVLDSGLLSRVYQIPVGVARDPLTGTVTVTPRSRRA
jgi:iron complex transport system ATP-binding protein